MRVKPEAEDDEPDEGQQTYRDVQIDEYLRECERRPKHARKILRQLVKGDCSPEFFLLTKRIRFS